MKIRLIGAADQVWAWSAELERAYGIKGGRVSLADTAINEVRAYFDLDERRVALIGLNSPSPVSATAVDSGAPKRSRTNTQTHASRHPGD